MLIKILNRLLPAILKPYFGKKAYQAFFERMHQWSLSGMQIGGGTTPDSSGEVEALHFIKERLINRPASVLFDVGANVGHYTCLLHQVFGENASIYAFEPASSTFEKLKITIENLPQVHCIQSGMGSSLEQMQLFSNPKKHGLSSVYRRNLNHFNITMPESEWVSINTIDHFCIERGIEYIDFLKLDVEGHEFEVLKGAKEMLGCGKIRFIQFEFGGCNIDSRTFFQDFYYLLSPKYQLYRIVQDGLFPLRCYKEAYEAFTTTNFLAEWRMIV